MADLLERLDAYCEPSLLFNEKEDPVMTFFYFQLREKVERLEKTLYRLADGMPDSLQVKSEESEGRGAEKRERIKNIHEQRKNDYLAKKTAFLKSIAELPEEEGRRLFNWMEFTHNSGAEFLKKMANMDAP